MQIRSKSLPPTLRIPPYQVFVHYITSPSTPLSKLR